MELMPRRDTRADQRRDMDHTTRLRLLEVDVDVLEGMLVEMNARLGRIMWSIMGLLLSITTGVVVFTVTHYAGGTTP